MLMKIVETLRVLEIGLENQPAKQIGLAKTGLVKAVSVKIYLMGKIILLIMVKGLSGVQFSTTKKLTINSCAF